MSGTGLVDDGLEARRAPRFQKDLADLKPQNSRVLVVDNATKARLASVVDFGLAPEPTLMKTVASEGRRTDGTEGKSLPGRTGDRGAILGMLLERSKPVEPAHVEPRFWAHELSGERILSGRQTRSRTQESAEPGQ